MASVQRSLVRKMLTALAVSLVFLTTDFCFGQMMPSADNNAINTTEHNPVICSDTVAADLLLAANASVSQPDPQRAAADDTDWHFSVSPYVWLPGIHGTVGAAGKQISVHATPGDLLSKFRFGLMSTAELRHKRLVIPVDVMWVQMIVHFH